MAEEKPTVEAVPLLDDWDIEVLGDSVWVCMACGKLSRDRHGERALHKTWDVSCSIHAREFKVKDVLVGGRGGRVVGLTGLPLPVAD